MRFLRVAVATLSLLLLSTCSPLERTPPVQEAATLFPYHTPLAITETSVPHVGQSTPSPASPTPTPMTHIVEPNETMIGIAIRYDVSLDSLLAENPGIDPRFLSIGQELVVPRPDGQGPADEQAQLEVAAIEYSEVECFRTPTDAVWCLLSVHSDLENPVEGIEMLVQLLDSDGQIVASAPAYGPLTRLLTGQAWPMAAYFPPSAPEIHEATAQVVAAIELEGDVSDLVELELLIEQSAPSQTGRLWLVTGEIALSADSPVAAGRVSLLGLAYDSEGALVGYNKWDSQGGLPPGEAVPFQMSVFSLGPEIDHLDFVVEGLVKQAD